jgi:prepilin-type processing-associated H-X9-DG protein
MYPSGVAAGTGSSSYSWHLPLLPHMEQMTLFNAYNFWVYDVYPQQSTVGYTQLTVFLCPSDGTSAPPLTPWATKSYNGNFGGPGIIQTYTGTIVPSSAWTTSGDGTNIGKGTPGPLALAAVTDGLSNTALFSERLIGLASTAGITIASMNSRRGIYQATTSIPSDTNNPAQAMAFVQNCKSLPGSTQAIASSYIGHQWVYGFGKYQSNYYNHFGAPNTISCANPNEEAGQVLPTGQWSIATATSNHPGGVNVCFSDGSVKFIKNSVNLTTWWALGTRAGGEVLSADSL